VEETKKSKAPVVPSSTNSVVTTPPGLPEPSDDGWFVGVIRFFKKFLWGLFLGLLLLGLLALFLRKRLVEEKKKQKAAKEQ